MVRKLSSGTAFSWMQDMVQAWQPIQRARSTTMPQRGFALPVSAAAGWRLAALAWSGRPIVPATATAIPRSKDRRACGEAEGSKV